MLPLNTLAGWFGNFECLMSGCILVFGFGRVWLVCLYRFKGFRQVSGTSFGLGCLGRYEGFRLENRLNRFYGFRPYWLLLC